MGRAERGRGPRGLALLAAQPLGCATGELAGGEVLCHDLACVEVVGQGSEQLGLAVETDGETTWAAGEGLLVAVDGDGGELGRWATSPGPPRLRLVPSGLLVDAEVDGVLGEDGLLRGLAAEAVLVDGGEVAERVDQCPDGSWVGVSDPDARVRCAAGALLWTECGPELCEVLRDGVVLGSSSRSGDLAWSGELACWGTPEASRDPAPGGWRCEDGSEGAGAEGDHLGVSLSDIHVAGVFDKWAVPARARVMSRLTGWTGVVDEAAWGSPLSVAEAGELLVVGVPESGGPDMSAGRVLLVRP